jgi:hypothetical protein
VPLAGAMIDHGPLAPSGMGQRRQRTDIDQLAWKIREIIADPWKIFHPKPRLWPASAAPCCTSAAD